MAILAAGWAPIRWQNWRVLTRSLTIMFISFLSMSITPGYAAEITIIHMGDLHGHLVPRPTIHGKTTARTEGGLARMYTTISEIRTGKQVQDVAAQYRGHDPGFCRSALYQGPGVGGCAQSLHIDAYVPGNWDWVYGVERALELFAGPSPKAPWNALAANAYYDGEPYADQAGHRVLPPYLIREIDGVKIGILGFTTDRGPQVVGRGVTKGVRFTKGDEELKAIRHAAARTRKRSRLLS